MHEGPVMETATDVLRARAKQREPLGRPYAFSLAGHAVLVAIIMSWPAGFLSSPQGEELLDDAMTVSLGGPAGPSQGGQTALTARPVQEVLPLEEANKPQWIQPPAPAPPEMTIPTPEARRRPEADVPVESAPDESRGRTPTRGPELRTGTALAETGAQGGGLGLSAGGLGSGGYLEVGNFCCPEYLGVMIQLIQQNWNAGQRFSGEVMMKFTIERNGRITNVLRETTSGYFALDQSAERALLLTDRLPPLPNRFDQDYLNVHLNFQYQP
jgi:TonB family protein